MSFSSTERSSNSPVLAVFLSNICLDELVLPGEQPLVDVVGGPGGYATLGARIFAEPPASCSVGWQMTVGYGFPSKAREEVENWDITLSTKVVPTQKSARGLQKYNDESFGPVHFEELSPAFDFSAQDLVGTGLLHGSAFHLLATPGTCVAHVTELLKHRESEACLSQCIIVWEPEPRTSNKSSFNETLQAASLVQVLSPNHLELRRLFVESPPKTRPTVAEIEKYTEELLKQGVGPDGDGVIVIRAAELGCLVASRTYSARWFPAYHSPDNYECERAKVGAEIASHPAVVDPTGAGNTFLGAFTLELARSGDLTEASCRAIVAAGFTVEQIAFPELEKRKDGPRHELWNGTAALDRLQGYKDQLGITS